MAHEEQPDDWEGLEEWREVLHALDRYDLTRYVHPFSDEQRVRLEQLSRFAENLNAAIFHGKKGEVIESPDELHWECPENYFLVFPLTRDSVLRSITFLREQAAILLRECPAPNRLLWNDINNIPLGTEMSIEEEVSYFPFHLAGDLSMRSSDDTFFLRIPAGTKVRIEIGADRMSFLIHSENGGCWHLPKDLFPGDGIGVH